MLSAVTTATHGVDLDRARLMTQATPSVIDMVTHVHRLLRGRGNQHHRSCRDARKIETNRLATLA